MSALKTLLKEKAEILEKKPWRYLQNETNIRAEVVEPILSCIGWKSELLEREYKGLDYMLLKDNNICTFIETKAIEHKLDLSLKINKTETLGDQISRYLDIVEHDRIINASPKMTNFGILTNGQEWQILKRNGQEIICVAQTLINNYNDNNCLSFFDQLGYERICAYNPKDCDPKMPWSKTDREKHFIIVDKKTGNDIDNGNNSAETIRTFVEKLKNLGYLEQLVKLSETRLVKKTIIKTNEKKKIKELNEKANHSLIDQKDGFNYYINTYDSTYIKRVIVKQLIDYFELNRTFAIEEKK